jgi:hypothetical protein
MEKRGKNMSIVNVEQLLEDILEIPSNAAEIAEAWLSITKQLAAFIESANDLLIIQTHSARYEACHPYLQICYEDDGAMTIEAVSNQFLRPKLSIDAQNTMLELGWELSDEPALPNYFRFLHKEDANPEFVAELFTRTLRCAYGITPQDSIEIRVGRGIWSNDQSDSSHDRN